MGVPVKRLKKILATAGIAVLLFATLWTVRSYYGGDHLGADFGDFSSSSDYDFSGGSDWSSSDDWSSSSDDWGSSGSDWGTSSNWGGNDYYYYNNSGSSYSSGDEGGGGMMSLMLIVIVWIVIIAVILMIQKNKKGLGDTTANQQPVKGPTLRTSDSELQPISNYSQLDPKFDANKLSEKIGNWYVQMQTAWTKKDITQLRPYFSDALYAQMEAQVQKYVQNHQTNYVEDVSVMGVKLRGYRQTGDVDEIIAEVTARIKDYTVDDKTGEVVKGSKTAEKFITYEYSLTRTKGETTEEQEALTTITCPHCAASVNINESAKCPYCGSVLTVAKHGWVISGMKGISQQTRG